MDFQSLFEYNINDDTDSVAPLNDAYHDGVAFFWGDFQ